MAGYLEVDPDSYQDQLAFSGGVRKRPLADSAVIILLLSGDRQVAIF
jgi:hypothetical protein